MARADGGKKSESHKLQELREQELENHKMQRRYDSRLLLQLTDLKVEIMVLTVRTNSYYR